MHTAYDGKWHEWRHESAHCTSSISSAVITTITNCGVQTGEVIVQSRGATTLHAVALHETAPKIRRQLRQR